MAEEEAFCASARQTDLGLEPFNHVPRKKIMLEKIPMAGSWFIGRSTGDCQEGPASSASAAWSLWLSTIGLLRPDLMGCVRASSICLKRFTSSFLSHWVHCLEPGQWVHGRAIVLVLGSQLYSKHSSAVKLSSVRVDVDGWQVPQTSGIRPYRVQGAKASWAEGFGQGSYSKVFPACLGFAAFHQPKWRFEAFWRMAGSNKNIGGILALMFAKPSIGEGQKKSGLSAGWVLKILKILLGCSSTRKQITVQRGLRDLIMHEKT